MPSCEPSQAAASNSTGSPSVEDEQSAIRGELEKLFDWNPQVYRGKCSPSTRPPAFFDQHLDDQLILKKIVHLPTLAADIAGIVDKFLPSDRILPSLPTDFNKRDWWEKQSRDVAFDPVHLELQVISNFSDLQAKFAPVAAGLAFAECWDSKLFSWKNAKGTYGHAVPDGFFSIRPPVDELSAAKYSKTKESLTDITKYFQNIGVWEFKNLDAGAKVHLEGILVLSNTKGPFPWSKCQDQTNCAGHYDASGPVVRGAPVGFDSTDSFCQQPSDPAQEEKDPGASNGRHPNKRKRKDDSLFHSISLAHQVWAELVRHDATYCVLHSGNSEMIFKRNRKQCILYASNVIDPATYAGYGKLQIGIFLIIYLDARYRTCRLKKALTNGNLPKMWLKYSPIQPASDEDTSPQTRKRALTFVEKHELQENLRRCARRSTLAVVVVKAGSLFRPHTVGTFKRIALSDRETDENDSVSLDIEDEISGSGMVFNAKLHAKNIKLESPLIVKWARSDVTCSALALEFENFQLLKPIFDAIPIAYGLFALDTTMDKRNGQGMILVMQRHGISLDKRGTAITRDDRMKCIRCLHQLHTAGYIHGNLTGGNVLHGDFGIRFCGLRNLQQSTSSRAKVDECLKLAQVLNDLQREYIDSLQKADEAKKRLRNDFFEINGVFLGPMSLETITKLNSSDHLEESSGFEYARAVIRALASKIEVMHPDLLYVETPIETGSRWWGSLMSRFPDIPYHCFQVSQENELLG
ncbi:hypothetical protein Hypma_003539 [Hypsizygus marmoreus]|uniref:Protein kinase domain-containing protein n=1 Tax=Hypsizygus marmoreus TaxID=39966 RepID=A0A369J4C3_HYPMA|nr:hypothetical protein Hypma_003539 [Hypsizygus marmoreus]